VTVGELSAKLRQRAEDAEAEKRNARRANAYNRGLIEASIDPLVTIGKDGKITDANAAAEMATGRSRTELVGSDFSDYFTDPEKARQGYERVFEEGLVRDYPLQMRDCAGSTTPVLYNATVYRDEAGEISGIFAAARDVSGLERARHELRTMVETLAEERKRLLDVLDVLPAYVILLTPDYHVPFANRIFRERFGESHGRRCFEYLFGRNEPCEVCETYKVLKTLSSERWEWTGPDGRDYDIFDFPFRDSGGSTLVLEMGLDITERKHADREIRRISRTNRALSRCNEAVIRATREETLFQTICDTVVEEAGYLLCWVGRADRDPGRSVTPIAQAGRDDGYVKSLNLTWADTDRGQGPTGASIRTREMVLTQHIATDPSTMG